MAGHTLVFKMASKRTTIRLSDERQLLLDRALEIIASGPDDDPPISDVIDAALTHLIESNNNMQDARSAVDPETIKRFRTSVITFRYRTEVKSTWR